MNKQRVAKGGLLVVFSLAVISGMPLSAESPRVVLLWPNGVPGAIGEEDADRPTLSIYLPSVKSVGTGIVVCPGGGYAHLAMDHEGTQIASWLNAMGVAAFVLKYRLGPRYHYPAQLQDAGRALRFVRLHAAEFGIAPDRVGIWGFSAGGHLASTLATHFEGGNQTAADPIDRMSSRPDFVILAYPVITMVEPYVHKGSREHLLGPNPDPKLLEDLSNEKQVTAQTPPTFLFLSDADHIVPPENSVLLYLALRRAGVPAEMHIYQNGPHGVGLAPNDPVLSSWPKRLEDWLRVRGMLPALSD